MSSINGETQVIGFFGATYRTSKMYAMYNAAFEALGLNYVYVPLIVNDLEKAVEGVRQLGIKAVGVTIPYKIDVVPYLDELDDDASRIGAVNVIVNRQGKLLGANTDGKGALQALQEVTTIAGKKVVLLGAGGAARAIAFALSDAGAEITILNRTEAAVAALATAVHASYFQYPQAGRERIWLLPPERKYTHQTREGQGERHYGTLADLEREVQDAGIVINATPVGMVPDADKSLVEGVWLSAETVVMDIVSAPRETKLLREAKARGCTVVYGERMLFWQGALKFKLYTGLEPPVEAMEKALAATREIS